MGLAAAPMNILGGSSISSSLRNLPFVAHLLDQGNELHGIDVVDILGLRVVAEILMVAREAEHIFYAQRVRPPKCRLIMARRLRSRQTI
jgi:hypothetical protein